MSASERDQACFDAALHFLTARPRSEREIVARLTEKGHESDCVAGVIERLRTLGLADDRAFAEFWLENRNLHRPRGARALKMELFQKGVDRAVVDEALEPVRDEADDAYRAARSRAATLSALDEPAFRQRLGQFLQRRGFGWESIAPAVERLWQDRGDPARPD